MYQDIPVKAYADVRESFRFSGWARANGIPSGDREGIGETSFRLYAEIHYLDGSADEAEYADFSPSVGDWQYASLEIAKAQRKTADFIRVGCEYSHNLGNASFDGFTLTRTSIESGLTADDFAGYGEDEETDGNTENTDDAELLSEDIAEDTSPEFEELTDAYANGETVARYTYDAWGVCTIASDTSERNNSIVNPFRYRSYYYDAEIGLYYLQSRYYNPTIGRFVNGDAAEMVALTIVSNCVGIKHMMSLLNCRKDNTRELLYTEKTAISFWSGH